MHLTVAKCSLSISKKDFLFQKIVRSVITISMECIAERNLVIAKYTTC